VREAGVACKRKQPLSPRVPGFGFGFGFDFGQGAPKKKKTETDVYLADGH
jgi:hypothetical protein